MSVVRFDATISPRQGLGPKVVCFTATPALVAQIAKVERIGRDAEGRLTGFQRPQIGSHIREIRSYLAEDDAMLPNAIILAFGEGATINEDGSLAIDTVNGPPGWVVDGQQRLFAALGLDQKREFEFIVSAFLCADQAELNRQFILVNNTRPLQKPLIYELLPNAAGLPSRLSDRTSAALLVEALNYRPDSSLRRQILQQTNPSGLIRDTLLQRMLTNSLQHGALRHHQGDQAALLDAGYRTVSDFFGAVQDVFADAWTGRTAHTSRLVHGAGLVAMGYVMDEISFRLDAPDRAGFAEALSPLIGKTRWTEGEWDFGGETRRWSSIQNNSSDYRLLSQHLVRLVRRSFRKAA